MARNRFSLGNMAREDDEVNADLTPEQGEAAVDEIVESPAEDIAEADQLAGELDEIVDGIGEVVGDAEELEGVADAIDATKAEGGVSAPAAEALNLMLNIVAKRHGIPLTGSFSRESFDSKTSRVKATEGLVDRVKDTANTIWKWLQKAYEKAKAWVIKWFNKFFDGATKLKDRAEKLEKLAKQKSGKTYNGTDKLDNTSMAEALADTSGKVPSGSQLTAAFGLLSKEVESGKAADLVDVFTKAAESITDQIGDEKKLAGILKQTIKDLISSGTVGKVKDGDDDVKYVIMEELLGGRCFAITVKDEQGDDIEELADALASIRGGIHVLVNAQVPKSGELPYLGAAECASLAGAIKDIATKLINSKNRLKKVEEGCNRVITAAKRQEARTAKGEDSDDTVARSKAARRALSGLVTYITAGVALERQEILRVGNISLNYTAASLGKLGTKEEKKNEKDIS